ncbi:haloacid dehalogenase [Croceivirga radicis]|uniref:Haloacid dehalogenase n=1 Tax=Croceivirga radicis TaxID=1929488 RepID=A0A1V6LNB9_9FLAO|nr:HAD family hydrolase [Croceivirga radicis]OQD41694.1 haloacid dehalogenase [Croceivirga radicis]
MDLSKIKMVVSDMDGTLLNNQHEVSKEFFHLFENLKKQNIAFVAASGRQYYSMLDKLKPIANDILFIAENGAFVKKQEQVLMTISLDQTYITNVLEVVDKIDNAHAVLCTAQTAYVKKSSGDFIEMLKEYYSEFTLVDSQQEVSDTILKIAIYHHQSSENYLYPELKQFEDVLKVKVSGENWLDISEPNAHKGYALQKVMDKHGINADEIMVFGDFNNDLEMMQLSNYSFAMANAHPNVKRIAKYQTLSNTEHGVEHILSKLLLAKS